MKLFNIIVAFLFIILLMGCEKPKEKTAGELYEEAKILLTDIEKADPVKAKEILDKVISMEPGFLGAYLSRADAHMSLGENAKAFEDFNKAIQIDPNSADIYYTRGKAYSNLKQYEKAIEDFTQALRFKPNFADAYFERGKVYFSKSIYQKAYEDLSKALSIDPNNTKATLYIDEIRPLLDQTEKKG